MDMKNIDKLAIWGECKKLLRQPTLIAKDLTLNSTNLSLGMKDSIPNSSGEGNKPVFSFFIIIIW